MWLVDRQINDMNQQNVSIDMDFLSLSVISTKSFYIIMGNNSINELKVIFVI